MIKFDFSTIPIPLSHKVIIYICPKCKEEYEVPIINGNEEAIKRLSAKILPFILRRTKNDVLQDLPAKYEEINIITLSQSQQDLYDAYLTKAKKSLSENMSMSVLAMITRLREVCLDPSIFLDDYNEISSKPSCP